MDPGDPSNMDQADAKINVNKEVALEAKIKKELDDLIDDFDEDDEEDDIFKGEDFESSEDFEDDSDSDYKSSLRSGARRIKKEIPEQFDDGSGIPCQSCQRTFLSQPNLNKHIGQSKKCKRHYENHGILPPELLAHQRRKNQLKDNHDNTSLDFQCEKCKKCFNSEGGVNRHVSKIKGIY